MRRAFLGAAIFLGSVVAAQAEVKLDLKYSSYDVQGLNISEIHSNIDRRQENGAADVPDGSADDEMKWTIDLEQANGSCSVRDNEVALRIEVLLPTWVDEARAPETVRSSWNAYFAQLKAHEEQHKDIAVQTAQRLDALLKAAQAEGPCDPFREELNKRAEQVVADEQKEQDRFEQNTPLIDLE
jgi:predicted secreted Zn-dependent protease